MCNTEDDDDDERAHRATHLNPSLSSSFRFPSSLSLSLISCDFSSLPLSLDSSGGLPLARINHGVVFCKIHWGTLGHCVLCVSSCGERCTHAHVVRCVVLTEIHGHHPGRREEEGNDTLSRTAKTERERGRSDKGNTKTSCKRTHITHEEEEEEDIENL